MAEGNPAPHGAAPEVVAALAGFAVDYEILPCDPALADTADFCAHYGYPLERSANTILVASKKEPKQYSASVVTGRSRLDVNKTVKRLMGAGRVSFAKPEETIELTGMELGGVTVLALPPELPIYVDAPIMALPWIILGAGSRSAKVKTAPAIFEQMPNATVVEGLSLPVPG